MWTTSRDEDRALLAIELFEPLSPAEADAVTDEGFRLLAFAEEQAGRYDVRFRPAA